MGFGGLAGCRLVPDRSGCVPLYAEEFIRILLDICYVSDRGATAVSAEDRELPLH